MFIFARKRPPKCERMIRDEGSESPTDWGRILTRSNRIPSIPNSINSYAMSTESRAKPEWSKLLTRRLEQVLHVHPEKYQHDNGRYHIPRSDRHTRNNTPEKHDLRSHSMDAQPRPGMDGANGGLLSQRPSISRNSPQRGTPESDSDEAETSSVPVDEIVTINVSGLRFQTYERTLARYDDTLLGNKSRRAKYWNPKAEEYFFDRSRSAFESILYIYQSNGVVKKPEAVPIDVFLREMRFFQMGDCFVEEFWKNEGYEKPKEHLMPKNHWQRCLWELMEYPDSSLWARIIAFISISVIVVSIVSFCWETIPSDDTKDVANLTLDILLTPTPAARDERNYFFWLEFACIIWFTIELLLRFISCPSKYTFLTSFLNIIDFVAIAPFFVNFIWADANKANSSMSFAVLRVLRLVRVFRIFKLSRHSVGLQILGKTFRASIQEFCLLIFFMVIALVLFSSGMYFAEQSEPNTKFTSIPASFWFVLVTMTTVGYGDLVPTGIYGKIVGAFCSLIGVLTLALPVPIIVANFKHFYRQENRLATMKTAGMGGDAEGGESADDEGM